MIRLYILVIACFLSGCGTFGTVFIEENKDCKSLIYSGTRFMSGGNLHSLFFIDIPFSLVADTILLPYTVPATLACEPSPQDPKKPEKDVKLNTIKDDSSGSTFLDGSVHVFIIPLDDFPVDYSAQLARELTQNLGIHVKSRTE